MRKQRQTTYREFVFKTEHRGDNYFEIEVYRGSERVGEATFRKQPEGFVVVGVDVDHTVRKQKLGTHLYRLGAIEACKQGSQLISDEKRSPFAEAFWRKQARGRRATCASKNTDRTANFYVAPVASLVYDLKQECRESEDAKKCVRDRLTAILAKTPAPKTRREDLERYWPCRRYAMKQCEEPLEGLRKNSSRSKREIRRTK